MLNELLIIGAAYLYTQRNPIRFPDANTGMLSPADGIVTDINDNIVKIFLNIHNVHVQRSPLSGIVKSVETYERDTGFCDIINGCPDINKFIMTIIETDYGEIEIRQKAGGIFSKPISFLKVGDVVEHGGIIGKITFGSGCSTTIPNGFNISVKVGDKVYADQTIIAEEIL